MDVVIVLVFASLILVIAALVFFVSRLRGGDFDHGERLSLLPLADDSAPVARETGTRLGLAEDAQDEERPLHDQR